MRRGRTPRRRRGTSLVEVLVVIALSGVMISAAGICLHEVYQVEQNVRDTAVRRQAIGRLSSQFRADAHGADTVRLRTEDVQTRPRLEFKNPDGSTIEYYQRDDEVIRTVRQADTVLHTDGFRFGRWSAVTWAVDDGQPPTASADLTRRSRRGIQVNGEYRQRIEAVVGLHASLLSGD